MRYILRLLFLPCLTVGLVVAGTHRALAQKKDQRKSSGLSDASTQGQQPCHLVQGHSRIDKKTGQIEQVKPYQRRAPAPKSVEVQSHIREGLFISAHQRKRPTPNDSQTTAAETANELTHRPAQKPA